MISRRTFGLAALSKIASLHGVRIGVSGYSFQGLTLDASIQAMKQIGLGACEAWFRHIEPKMSREELRAWRLTVPLETYAVVASKFKAAGIEMVAYTFDMKDDFTDAELERGFQMAKALGVRRIATSTTFTVAKRIVPMMEQHRMEVAFHGHSNAADPNQFAGPDAFEKVLKMSPYARINLDIGQFVAAGFEPVPFIRDQHTNISLLHIRDGKKGLGTKLEWGTGDTPIQDVLRLLQKERYRIQADIEYDYGGPERALAEIMKCFAYCKNALKS